MLRLGLIQCILESNSLIWGIVDLRIWLPTFSGNQPHSSGFWKDSEATKTISQATKPKMWINKSFSLKDLRSYDHREFVKIGRFFIDVSRKRIRSTLEAPRCQEMLAEVINSVDQLILVSMTLTHAQASSTSQMTRAKLEAARHRGSEFISEKKK